MRAVRIVREKQNLRGIDARRRSFERELQAAPGSRRKGPCVNIYESLDAFKICVAAPGVAAGDFDLQISEDRVVIACHRDPGTETDEEFRRQERWQGGYRREIRLSAKIVPEGVAAECTNGVLSILLPKWQSAPLRRVAVNDGSTKSQKDGGPIESTAS